MKNVTRLALIHPLLMLAGCATMTPQQQECLGYLIGCSAAGYCAPNPVCDAPYQPVYTPPPQPRQVYTPAPVAQPAYVPPAKKYQATAPAPSAQTVGGCTSDLSCGYGRICLRVGYEPGVCAQPVNKYGTPTQPAPAQTCTYQTDCSVGFVCSKTGNNLTGFCVK